MTQPQRTLLCLAAALSSLALTASAQSQDSTTLPPVVVTGSAPETELHEDQPIGPNEQPEWTTRRRFARTRVYVAQPWQWEFEQWWRGDFPREGKADHLFQSELSLGLPYRFQLDFYENYGLTDTSNFQHFGHQVEGRWALADWGKIPLNPTLYGEWKFNNNEPDTFELKVLLGEDLAPRWHWGFNAFWEQLTGGDRESALGFSQGLSYSLLDQKLGVGIEMQLERTSARNFDGKPDVEFLLGPSLQWRPTPRTHLDLVPLFGTTSGDPLVQAFVVFGFDLGPNGNHAGGYIPTSTGSR